MKSLLLWVWLAASTAWAAGDDAAAARQRLATERAAIESRFRAQEASCRDRFAVTPCIDEAKAQRREALNKVREQELRWDDLDRRHRAEARTRGIADKRAEAASRAAAAASSASSADGSRPLRPALTASAPAHAQTPASRAPLDGGPQAAAERAAKAKQRQADATARAERIGQRELKRLQKGKKAAPLPDPP